MKKESERILELAGLKSNSDEGWLTEQTLNEDVSPLMMFLMTLPLAGLVGQAAWYHALKDEMGTGLSDVGIAKEKLQNVMQKLGGGGPSDKEVAKIYFEIKKDHRALKALDALVGSKAGGYTQKQKSNIRQSLIASTGLSGRGLGSAEVLMTKLINYHISRDPKLKWAKSTAGGSEDFI